MATKIGTGIGIPYANRVGDSFANFNVGLIRYYQFDNDYTDDTVTYDGTAEGAGVSFTGTTGGIRGRGTTWTSANGAVLIGAEADFDITAEDFTFRAWFKTSVTDNSLIIWARAANTPWSYGLRLNTSSNTIDGGVSQSTASIGSVSPSTDLDDGEWHLLHHVHDESAGESLIYLDGALVGTIADGINTLAVVDTLLGARRVNNVTNTGIADSFQGELDEVALWNRVLTPSEIAADWNAGQGKFLDVSLDADAVTYFEAVNSAGSDLSFENKIVWSDFISNLKDESLWALVDEIHCYRAVSTLAGAIVKPKSIAASTNNNFVEGDYDPADGLTGDGSTKYIDTNYTPSSSGTMTVTSAHTAVWTDNVTAEESAQIGAITTGLPVRQIILSVNSVNFAGPNGIRSHLFDSEPTQGELVVSGSLAAAGLTIGTRTAANDHRIYVNGTQAGATQTTTGGSLPPIEIAIFAINDGSSRDFLSGKPLKYVSYGQGFTSAQAQKYNELVASLMGDLT